MTEKSDKLSKQWDERIRLALKYRAHVAKSGSWKMYRDLYNGDFVDEYEIIGKGMLPVNVIFAMGRKTVPNVVLGNPYLMVKGHQPNTSVIADIVERMDNLLWKRMDMTRHTRLAALEGYLTGIGTFKRGFDSQYGFDALAYALQEDTRTGKKGERLEHLPTGQSGMPWVMSLQSGDYVVPWGARTDEDIWWEAIRIWRPYSDLKADTKFKNMGLVDAIQMPIDTSENVDGILISPKRSEILDDEEGWVAYWEIHDYREKNVTCLVGAEHGEDHVIIREGDDKLCDNNHKICASFTYNDSHHYYGVSDCKLALPQQLELNDIRTQAMYARRLANIKILFREGVIDQVELDKFLSEFPAVAIKIAGAPTAENIMPFRPSIPMDYSMAAQQVMNDLREQLGFSRNQMGQFGPARKTKGEATIVQQAFQIQMDDRRMVVGRALVKVMEGVNDSIFRYWDTSMVMKLVGADGVPWWVQFTGQDLKADYTLSIDLTAEMPQSVQGRKQQLMEMMQMFGQMPMINQQEIVEYLLSQYPGLDTSRIMTAGPGAGANPEQAMGVNDFVKGVNSGNVPYTPSSGVGVGGGSGGLSVPRSMQPTGPTYQ